MPKKIVWFVHGNDATVENAKELPLLQVSFDDLEVIPGKGDAVKLKVYHSSESRIYRVQDVMHVFIVDEKNEVIVAVN